MSSVSLLWACLRWTFLHGHMEHRNFHHNRDSSLFNVLMPIVLPVLFPPPLVTMRPQRPSPSPHWLVGSMVMPCDWACPACSLGQSSSLYLRDWSMEVYLNPTRDSKDCSDIYYTVFKKSKAKGLWVDDCTNPDRPDGIQVVDPSRWVTEIQSESFSHVTRAAGYWFSTKQECCNKDEVGQLVQNWQTERKSEAILYPLVFWNVTISLKTKWWTKLGLKGGLFECN